MPTEIYEWIKRQVTTVASERGIEISRAFPAWLLGYVHELELDDALDQTDTLEGGDAGLDGWFRDEDDKAFHLWQFKWTDDSQKDFDKSAGEELFAAADGLLFPAVAGTHGGKFLHVAALLTEALDHDYRLVLNVAVPTSFSKKAIAYLEAKAKHLNERLQKERDATVELRLVDGPWLEKLQLDRLEDDDVLAGVQVRFDLGQDGSIDLHAPSIPEGWRAAIVNLEGQSLGKMAQEYGSRLFGRNVRYALPHKQKRIDAIRKQLSSPEAARMFWFYNNGLTILCDAFALAPDKASITITNPQVVNGCQTVSAFRAKLDSFGDSAFVLARVIRPPNDQAPEQAAKISQWTNSQTPVLARDLRANDKVQKLLQNAMRLVSPPWFYETKRGEWNTLSQAERASYNDRRVDIESIGQSTRMLLNPAGALTQKKELFEDEDVYGEVFRLGRDAREYLVGELLRREFSNFWRNNNLVAIQEVCGAEVITPEMLARLMRAKSQVVSHCVALTGQLLRLGEKKPLLTAPELYERLTTQSFTLVPWLRYMGIALQQLVENVDQIKSQQPEEARTNIKKYFERPGNKTLDELWRKIAGTGNILGGKSWGEGLVKAMSATP